ncbi:RNA-binding domain-containing protein [Ascodesmis nigricans]|uniref:Eukaryotic translation initiation factor 3 subunit G n=1 Tax=Ascodesmis nigricans TaxID=341454 RepID=A0A4S2N246_9PEZI|nr:RNA-binding domain-containing protein [Ascodesmis nigricans]
MLRLPDGKPHQKKSRPHLSLLSPPSPRLSPPKRYSPRLRRISPIDTFSFRHSKSINYIAIMAPPPPAPASRQNWADDDEFDDATALPPQQITSNPDGTKTIVTWRWSETNPGKKIKTTRKIKTTIHKETVNPHVAARKQWAKFGAEKGHPAGPDLSTTSVGENILFRPSINWRAAAKEEDAPENKLKDQLKDKKVACRICKGDHFTARCPFKDTLPPLDDVAAGTPDDLGLGGASGAGDMGGSGGGTSYVPPHLRNKGKTGGGETMGGRDFGSRQERDELATLRVTNVSEFAEEGDLRDMFERFGRVTRVFLAKDRDTGRAKGFAFVSFADRSDAARACEKVDGMGFMHLILRVEFSKKPAQ